MKSRRNWIEVRSSLSTFAALMACLAFSAAVAAQRQPYAPQALTAEDYARAEKFLAYKTNPLVSHMPGRGTWFEGDRFWYRVSMGDGSEFVLVDAAKGTRAPAFDHERLAAALSSATGICLAA